MNICVYKKHTVRLVSIAWLIAAMLTLASCANGVEGGEGAENPAPLNTPISGAQGGQSGIEPPKSLSADGYSSVALSSSVTERDADASFDEAEATLITLAGTDAKITGAGASASNGYITINGEGTYILSGDYEGTVAIELPDDAKAQLVLAGVSIEGQTGPAILIREADKVFITLKEGASNTLTDAEAYTLAGEDEGADAAIYSKADMTINGAGALTVNGRYTDGIASKDDLTIAGGDITVNAIENALSGKDCVKIAGGTLALTSGKHGIRSSNGKDAERGYVTISGGEISITAEGDGINAVNDIAITGGALTLRAADDGIHSDSSLYIVDGTLDIAESNEGLEGASVFIGGGDIALKAYDDGINAAGGADASGGEDAFVDSADYVIDISGGFIMADASGDGIDSNGAFVMSGGTVVLSGPEDDSNGPLDYDTASSITGGLVLIAGSSGMARNFGESSTQCAYLYTGEAMDGGRLTLVDGEGNVLLSGVVEKRFSSVLVSSPGMRAGETYSLMYGGKPKEADAHGFASSGTLSGGEEIAKLTQTDTVVGQGKRGF